MQVLKQLRVMNSLSISNHQYHLMENPTPPTCPVSAPPVPSDGEPNTPILPSISTTSYHLMESPTPHPAQYQPTSTI
ncbi:unnamed protein product [Gadus morhua 'NCC']